MQDSLQAPYQILLIILLKEIIKLNVNMGKITKTVERVELNARILIVVLGNVNKTSLPEKKDFYSHLNMSDITDADYTHAK